jgi:hypothetical protein
MAETQTDEIEIGTQVTTPHGIGVVTWVEVGGDEFKVLRYDRPQTDFRTGATVGSGPDYVTVDRAHIAFWPARKPADAPTGSDS